MPRGQGFRHRGHADCVRANRAKKTDLCRRLVAGSVHGDVHPMRYRNTSCARRRVGDCSETPGVHLAHVRKSRTEPLVIGAQKRVAPEQVDVVVDDHQRAARETGIDAPGGVREDDLAYAEPPHHACRKDDGRKIVSFVKVRPSGQRGDAPAAYAANYQLPGMPDDAGGGPMRQFGVGHPDRVEQRVGKVAEA